MGLLCGESCVILTLTVFDWSTRVTDRGTDRGTDRQTGGRMGVSKERAIAYMLSRAKKGDIFLSHSVEYSFVLHKFGRTCMQNLMQQTCAGFLYKFFEHVSCV